MTHFLKIDISFFYISYFYKRYPENFKRFIEKEIYISKLKEYNEIEEKLKNKIEEISNTSGLTKIDIKDKINIIYDYLYDKYKVIPNIASAFNTTTNTIPTITKYLYKLLTFIL